MSGNYLASVNINKANAFILLCSLLILLPLDYTIGEDTGITFQKFNILPENELVRCMCYSQRLSFSHYHCTWNLVAGVRP
jgi:hypothetical protein